MEEAIRKGLKEDISKESERERYIFKYIIRRKQKQKQKCEKLKVLKDR